jgi:hypothetical protein
VNRIKRAAEVLGLPTSQKVRIKLVQITTVTLGVTSILFSSTAAFATNLASSSTSISDPRPSASAVSYTFKGGAAGGLVTSSLIKCVKVVVSNSATTTTAPTGFSGTGATVTAASSTLINSSASGWTLVTSDGTASAGQNNIFTYTNTTGVTPSTTTGATFIIAGLTNGSVADTKYWYYLNTYTDTSCTTPVDSATTQFIYTNGSTLSLTVDNTLSFTVNAVASAQACNGTTTTQASTATTIPFGTVSAASNGVVCQDLTAATNATNGYTIFTRYTAKPTNALAQTIADHTGSNTTPTAFSAAGTEAYGYSTNDATLGTGTPNRFTSPTNEWAAETTTNSEVAYEAAGVTSTTYRIGHQVGISLTTRPGTYTTTIIYTCTPVY